MEVTLKKDKISGVLVIFNGKNFPFWQRLLFSVGVIAILLLGLLVILGFILLRRNRERFAEILESKTSSLKESGAKYWDSLRSKASASIRIILRYRQSESPKAHDLKRLCREQEEWDLQSNATTLSFRQHSPGEEWTEEQHLQDSSPWSSIDQGEITYAFDSAEYFTPPGAWGQD